LNRCPEKLTFSTYLLFHDRHRYYLQFLANTTLQIEIFSFERSQKNHAKMEKAKKLLQDKVYVRMFEKKNRKNFLKKNVFEIGNIALNALKYRISISKSN
jgi:hypothetical protein